MLLAFNYFAFQVELFDDEYEANHPSPSAASGISAYNVTWESFDKDNAPAPFVFDARISFVSLFRLPREVSLPLVHFPGVHPVRDKSPPDLLLTIS